MKKLAVLIALLLALSPLASALTLENKDFGNTAFVWGSYRMTIGLVTDDPGALDYTPAEAKGAMVMVRLAPISGQVALYDIVAGAKRFELKDASGAFYQINEWHVPGRTDKNGTSALNNLQNWFELIYHLPEGVSTSDVSLILRDDGGNEHLLAPLTASAAEMSAQPSADQKLSDFVMQLLAAESEKAKDPWVKAILDAGVSNIQLLDGTLTFMLRSFNPGLKTIKEKDPGEFMRLLYQNASAYDLKCTLTVTEEEGLAATAKSQKAFVKSVTKAASQSKKGFNDKKARAALAGYLLSNQASQDLRPGAPNEEFEALFLMQQKQTLSVSDGPHALRLGTVGVTAEELLLRAYDATYQKLAKQQDANALPQDEIKIAYLQEMKTQAAALKKKGAEKTDFVLDIDRLFDTKDPDAGDAYNSFIFKYDGVYNVQLSALYADVAAMPDYPAVDFPKSGRISGSTGGTKVVIKVPKEGYATLIQMRKVDNDELMVTAFAQPGQSATVRVPKGQYYMLLASGPVWYGDEHMFGDGGYYVRTQDLQIKGSNYYHVITLGGAKEGNMSAYDVEPYEFQQAGGTPDLESM